MSRSTLVLLGVAVLAVAEIAVLAQVARAIGVLPLLLVLALEAALGGWLLQREGRRAWASLKDAQRDPERMGPALTDAGLVFVGGILLILPGFITDVLSLLFLVPATRGLARRAISTAFKAATRTQRDQADLLAAKWDRSTVVEGQTVDDQTVNRAPAQPDPNVIRGEIDD